MMVNQNPLRTSEGLPVIYTVDVRKYLEIYYIYRISLKYSNVLFQFTCTHVILTNHQIKKNMNSVGAVRVPVPAVQLEKQKKIIIPTWMDYGMF